MANESKRKHTPKGDKVWPEPIPDTFENIVKAIVNAPKREEHEWRYLNEYREPEGA